MARRRSVRAVMPDKLATFHEPDWRKGDASDDRGFAPWFRWSIARFRWMADHGDRDGAIAEFVAQRRMRAWLTERLR